MACLILKQEIKNIHVYRDKTIQSRFSKIFSKLLQMNVGAYRKFKIFPRASRDYTMNAFMLAQNAATMRGKGRFGR